MESTEIGKKLGNITGGDSQESIHNKGHDTNGESKGSRIKKAITGEEEKGRGIRRTVQMDYQEGKDSKPAERVLIDRKHLKCMYTNIDSLTNKKNELETRICQAQHKPDIIGITETNPKNSKVEMADQDYQIDGYFAYTSNAGRGIALYIEENIKSSRIVMNTDCGASVWCEIPLNGQDRLIVGLVYRSPNSDKDYSKQVNTAIYEAVQRGCSHVLLFGDFNYPDIDWTNQHSKAPEDHPSHDFLTCVQDCFLFQHVYEPTHYRALQKANILDLILTNEESMVDTLTYNEPIGKSHHVCLSWNYNCYLEQAETKSEVYSYSRGDYDEMRNQLGLIDWEEKLENKSVEQMWSIISQQIHTAVNWTVPHRNIRKNVKRRSPLWMNTTTMAMIKKKKRSYEKYLQTRDGKEYVEYTRARNQAKTQIRRAVREYEKDIAKKAKKDPKAFYKYVNTKLKTRNRITNLTGDDGTIISEDGDKAEVFSNFFSKVFTVEDMQNVPLCEMEAEITKLIDIQLTTEDVYKLLSKLKINKSPGPDKIHPQVLKECAAQLATPLQKLFRKSLDEGIIPESWKEGHVTPIFKKGTRTDVANYRPISLTSVVCKTLERIIREAVLKHMMDNNLLSDRQHGFVPGRSTMTQLLEVFDKWTECLDLGFTVDVIYLDFAKAFDTVPHHRMLLKMKSYGIDGKIIEWIKSFLIGRRQRVQIGGMESAWAPVTSGIPQGSVLGPLLFICFINDMPTHVTSDIYIYADDTKLSRCIRDEADCRELQNDLDRISHWCEIWHMILNITKCSHAHWKSNCY